MTSTRSRSTALALVLVVAAACSAPGSSDGTAKVVASPASHGSPSTQPHMPVERVEPVARFEQLGFSGFLVADPEHDRLWSGSSTGLGWIDPQTGATHTVDQKAGVYLAVHGDSLYRDAWAHNNVARYDIAGAPREAVRRPAPSPLNVAAGPAGVWASDHDHGSLLRLDPTTLRVVRKVRIGSGKGLGPAGLVWQGGNLWVNVKRDSTLALVDGHTGAVLRRVTLPGVDIGDDMALTSSGLWAMVSRTEDSSEWQLVDTQTGRVKARVDVGAMPSATPVEIDGQTWLPVGNRLLHLDPNRAWQPDRAVFLGTTDLHPRWATAGFGSLWISGIEPSRIVRVDLTDVSSHR